MSNDKFKRIKEKNDNFIQFLVDVGFTEIDGKYKFIKPEV